MDVLLLIAAVVFSLAALVVAIASDRHARRATHSFALEVVSLRSRLDVLGSHAGLDDSLPSGETAAHELAVVVQPRLERLERRLNDLTDAPPTPSTGTARPESESAEARILGALRRDGYGSIVVLETLGPDAVRVEAERSGMTVKGVARFGADGAVVLATVSSARAFP